MTFITMERTRRSMTSRVFAMFLLTAALALTTTAVMAQTA